MSFVRNLRRGGRAAVLPPNLQEYSNCGKCHSKIPRSPTPRARSHESERSRTNGRFCSLPLATLLPRHQQKFGGKSRIKAASLPSRAEPPPPLRLTFLPG